MNLTSSEAEKLEKYCSITGRPATDVIRELIRSVPIEEGSNALTVRCLKFGCSHHLFRGAASTPAVRHRS
ncbi:hypothetical protein [Nostoc flagelliforme]|uniref:hypothetical protein n=1 Tax=Nostoc flagelliforme TaxID=1306274 RepID=UPI001CEDC11D|nr:hypothetical protein [Nostoc flagelliforme]